VGAPTVGKTTRIMKKKKKIKNGGITRRKDTLAKKAYELGEFDGIDILYLVLGESVVTLILEYSTLPG